MGRGGLGFEKEVLGKIEDQDGPHAVVGETLPHLGKKQDEQPLWMLSEQLDKHGNAGHERDQNAQGDDDVHALTLT